MKLRINSFLLFCLIATSIALNACGATQNQTPNLQPSLAYITSTPVPETSTATSTLTPATTETPFPAATATFLWPLPTFPPNCGTVKLGSAGTQTIDTSRKTLVQGTAILCGQIYFSPHDRPKTISVIEGMIDLDTGAIDLSSADLEFCPGAGSMIFYGFCNANNAFVQVYSLNGLTMEHAHEPTFGECRSITKPTSNDNDNEPEYACVITNLGNISRIKVEQYNPLGYDAMALEISFITWEK